ncbi:phosphatidate cytidylyltransferase [Pseudoclavibacter caeni]|jgi:phosphatidate cytidylyltransferase|uniref:Phosphatidate cytidylyltransferase n=1 Tax=Pseudoclavibacter caeni TaxID=908846 RepID=A0A7C8BRD5_9MICO|nr:phosphatidate cytidylyltransferase [Pseudoclavibacter caeni]KAB1632304.1 phosphatidate cytidylyltransferase [Pseudoclavibacter caeni]NYJ97536.1 phosphatidate cytidylyltransferase [Pseudoclavibacter caeni]
MVKRRRADERHQQVRQLIDQVEQANEQLEQRAGRNLPLAIGMGLLLGAIVLGAILISTEAFVVLAMLVTGVAAAEIAHALANRGLRPSAVLTGILAGVLPGVAWWAGGMALLFVLVAVVLLGALAGAVVSRLRGAPVGPGALWSALIILVVGGCLGTVGLTVTLPDGLAWLLVVLISVVSNDTGAYALGVLVGRHPLAPRISPKKTWEGQLGALVSSTIAACISVPLLTGAPWWWGLVLGPLTTITATTGDLVESTIKRWLGVKDMSRWIPGHGGVMDRLDAVVPSVPLALLIAWWAGVALV